MRFRKLRIAWSVACGIASALLILLWVRSCYRFDVTWGPISKGSVMALASAKGLFVVAVSPRPSKGAISKSVWGFESYPHSNVTRTFGLAREIPVPYFLPLVVTAVLAGLPWLRWRFTLRTLLITMMLVAVVLGLIVAVLR